MFIGGLLKAVRRKIQTNEEQENLPTSLKQKRRKKSQKSTTFRRVIQEENTYTNVLANCSVETNGKGLKEGNQLEEMTAKRAPIETLEKAAILIDSNSAAEQSKKFADCEEEEPNNRNRRRFSTSAATTAAAKGRKFQQMSTQQRIEKLKERFRMDASETELVDQLGGQCCSVCLFQPATVRTFPCGHQVFCRLCAITLIQSLFECGKEEMHCTICRAGIAALRHQKKGGGKQQKCEEHSNQPINNNNNNVLLSTRCWRRHWRNASSYRKRTVGGD